LARTKDKQKPGVWDRGPEVIFERQHEARCIGRPWNLLRVVRSLLIVNPRVKKPSLVPSLIFLLSAVSIPPPVNGEQAAPPKAAWVQHLNGCYLDSKGSLGREGVAALSSREIVAYCVTRNPRSSPTLSERSKSQASDPFQLNVFFLDVTDGKVLQTATWPTLVKTQADIFSVSDDLFLLAAGNSIQLIERKTLSTIRRLALAEPRNECEPWKIASSIDGTSFGVSQICHRTPEGYFSEISVYSTSDFRKIESWNSEGRNFYDVNQKEIIRWSTENGGLTRDLSHYSPNLGETTLHSRHLVSQSRFLNEQEIFCCRNSTWLGILRLDGQEVAYRDADPHQEPANPKTLTDQIFVSRTGQRMGALIFHVPWAGALRWECAVFDMKLNLLMKFDTPKYHHDFTAVLSTDDRYVFILNDIDVAAYPIPKTPNP
jgi:hypothetical protein